MSFLLLHTALCSLTLILLASPLSTSQTPAPSPPSYAFANRCTDNIALRYEVQTITRSYPIVQDSKKQPWTFTAQAQLVNHGEEDVKDWQLYVGFQHNEVLVSANGAVLSDGTQLPAAVGNGTIIASISQPDLKNAIDTAMDMNQIAITIPIIGTEFGTTPPAFPLPTNISLVGFKCEALRVRANVIETCCSKNNLPQNARGPGFPLETGDITIFYDIIQTFPDNYLAKVTISNDNPLGRLDFWNLRWDWQFGEFIYAMQGAETVEQEQSTCITGVAGKWYKDMDFSQVMSCQSDPTIIDLDQYKANDSMIGRIPFCCRNGTLLPANIDVAKSKSIFQLKVYKIPPHNQDRSDIAPPINWRINGSFDASYICGQPRLVAPSEFPDPASSVRTEAAFISWQVTCNTTKLSSKVQARCCVSFSAFYNESVVPCTTCACGCQKTKRSRCNQTAQALLLPPEVLPVPFVNRTLKTLAWARLKHHHIPNPLPCGDNCGVSINWHLNSDFTKGWTARITVFNWGTTQFANWFIAVQLGKTFPGFEKVYSFNGTSDLPGVNNTILMQGLPGFNYLNGIFEGHPGLQQSILSFSKKGLPAGKLVARDFFPSKVIFDGAECDLPEFIPSSSERLYICQALLALVLSMLLLTFRPFGLHCIIMW